MIVKGFDFFNVILVGVISVDIFFYFFDFCFSERMFGLVM